MFAKGRVAIGVDGEVADGAITPAIDVIWIRNRMSVAVQQAVQSEATSMKGSGGRAMEVDIDVGLYQLALLRQNILAWQGPSFNGVVCTPETIGELDASEPLVQRVLQEISDRNARRSPNATS
jgi:hypothetical protein